MTGQHRDRRKILEELGADPGVAEELLQYNAPVFTPSRQNSEFPLPSEPHLVDWHRYRRIADQVGHLNALRDVFPQFRFPIEEGICGTERYQAATRRGEPAESDRPLNFEDPEGIRLIIHETVAGEVPVITFSTRRDFVSAYRAFVFRNEPKPLPDAVGAVIIGGYNNWDRVQRFRREWEAAHPGEDWQQGFSAMLKNKANYQDSFILLSEGPYSGVTGDTFGFSEAQWRDISGKIRLEHECTHYFSRRVFSSMRNNLIDELMADYAGITAAAGGFKSDWFLTFLGLGAFPEFDGSGRLQQYRGGLSDSAFSVLQVLTVRAARHVQTFDETLFARRSRGPKIHARCLFALSRLTLEQIASPEGSDLLLSQVKHSD